MINKNISIIAGIIGIFFIFGLTKLIIQELTISQFLSGVQTICNIFPASQITIILRNVLLNGILENQHYKKYCILVIKPFYEMT